MASQDSQSPQVEYGLSCPDGGDFYICLSSQIRFVGCCETDPCSGEGDCPQDALRPASYTYYPGRHQSCVKPYDEREWYTCDFAVPKFMGCCMLDPCDGGCPDEDLIPARLDDDDDIAAPFLSLPLPVPSSPPPQQPSNGTTTTPEYPSPGPSPTDAGAGDVASSPGSGTTAEASPTSPSGSTGLIVGLSMTGVVILLIVVGFKIWWRKISRIWELRNRRRRDSGSPGDNVYQPEKTSQHDDRQRKELHDRHQSQLSGIVLGSSGTRGQLKVANQ
ncbi:hypothetical protein GGR54DRAFT_637583 [Hypoxylon sp. NC1633]|nr:hypothetical protein GGR54DRAFT_637583 [Hypoxylon sp. NC1633]